MSRKKILIPLAKRHTHHRTLALLSAGGTLSAWIAQNRTEVTRAVLIAPALGFSRHEGTHLQKGIALLLPLLPDIRTDWLALIQILSIILIRAFHQRRWASFYG